MWTTYLWEVVEDSELYGKFFTRIENGTEENHREFLSEVFPFKKFQCLGQATEKEMEEMEFICFQKTLDNSDSI